MISLCFCKGTIFFAGNTARHFAFWGTTLLAIGLGSCKGGSGPVKADSDKPARVEPVKPGKVDPANDTYPAGIAQQHNEDAGRLALRDLRSWKAGQVEGANMPTSLVATYATILKDIYLHVKSHAEIPDITSIHTWPSPDLHKVRAVLKKDATWLEAWKKGQAVTDDIYLNQTMSKYGMKPTNYRETGLGPTFDLVSPMMLNTPEFALLIAQVEGFKLVEAENMVGDGNNIKSNTDGKNHRKVEFIVGYGDCQSGCISHTIWTFLWQEDHTITYMGQSGDPEPEGWREKPAGK